MVDYFSHFGLKEQQAVCVEEKQEVLFADTDELDKLDLSLLTKSKRKCIRYAKDGNTVVEPYVTVSPATEFIGDSGKYWWLELVPNQYNAVDVRLYNDIGEILVYSGWIWARTVQHIREYLQKATCYAGQQGLRLELEERKNKGCHISTVQIRAMAYLDSELAKEYANYRNDRMLRAEQEGQKKAEQERLAREREERERKEALTCAMNEAEERLLRHERVENTMYGEVPLLVHLMKKYGVSVPPATRGWISNKLVSVCVNIEGTVSYTYRRRISTSSGGSDTFCECMDRLIKCVKESRGVHNE